MSRFPCISWLLGLCLVVFAFGCGGGARAAATPPVFDPAGQTKCKVQKSSNRPLIIEWPSADRATLESTARHGLVVVRYSGCEMEVLPRCQLGGSYRYTATTRKVEKVSIRDADELYAELPVGAARLEAKLAKAGELDVAMQVVGRFDAVEPEKPTLEGACDGATHVVTAMTSGAFEFYAGAGAEAGGGLGMLGVGAGTKSQSRHELLSEDGDPKACAVSTMDDSAPPSGCGAVLRLEVSELDSLVTLTKSTKLLAPPALDVANAGAASVAPIRPGPGVVRVHIDSPDPNVELEGDGAQRLDPVGSGFIGRGPSTLLCRAPCDTAIDARLGQPLRISGANIPASQPFQVYEKEGDVTAHVRPGSSSALTWGGISAGTGVLAIITGGSLLMTGAIIKANTHSDSDMSHGASLEKWGGITLAGGVVLTSAGVVLLNAGSTDVVLEGGNAAR